MGTGCNFESFTAGTWQQHFVLPTALTNVTAIRYNLTAATWGNDPDYDSAHVSNAPYTWQGSPPHLTMDDLRVYSN
jgi:hypothetical protein